MDTSLADLHLNTLTDLSLESLLERITSLQRS
jgi:hypothetical protein